MTSSAAPGYVRRIARLPRVLDHLRYYPDGLSISELAERFEIPAAELHQDLLAFYSADVDASLLFGLSRADVLEFVTVDGREADPNRAAVVRVSDPRPAGELGMEYVAAQELALIYTAAVRLHEIEPDNVDLAGALEVLRDTLFGDTAEAPRSTPRSSPGSSALEPLREAASNRRRARIVYSRSWDIGVRTRVIEPYRLVSTRRGWEVDAGVPGSEELRTYLVSHVREVELLDETFEPPVDLDQRLAAQRATHPVTVCLPHSARWAADMYAESVTATDEDGDSVTLELELLPPLARRVGLLLLASGPEGFVVSPRELADADHMLAAELLEHHRA
ncbi:MAG: WYL domain-containing protein [Nocardioidaceae bacterium]